MPRNGSGIWTPPAGTNATANTTIKSSKYNAFVADVALGLTGSLAANGETPWSGAQNANGYKITNLAAAASANDAARLAQTVTGYLTTKGDLVYRGSTTPLRLGIGSSNTVLLSTGSGPAWGKIGTGNFAEVSSAVLLGNTAVSSGPVQHVKLGDGLEVNASTATLRVKADKNPIQGGYKNLKIVSAGGGVASVITCGAITVEDSDGYSKRLKTVSVTATFSGNGADGLDTGSIASATWYYLWVIYNPATSTTAALGSLSSTAPTMPAGYTYKAYVGAVRTKSGSAVLVGTIQYGKEAKYTPAPLPSMILGGSGSITVPTWTAVAVANFVPPTASHIIGVMRGASCIAAPNNTYGAYNSAGNPPPEERELYITAEFCFALESSNIYYASNASSATSGMWASGWIDNNL